MLFYFLGLSHSFPKNNLIRPFAADESTRSTCGDSNTLQILIPNFPLVVPNISNLREYSLGNCYRKKITSSSIYFMNVPCDILVSLYKSPAWQCKPLCMQKFMCLVFIFNFYLFHFWLCWFSVVARGLSLVTVSGDHSLVKVHRLFTAVASLVAGMQAW